MVIVKDVKPITKDDGETFYALIVEGSVEPVRSKKTGRIYFSARKATVPTTMDEKACRSAIGAKFEGEIQKVVCEPYDYTIESTGETIQLDHRWEFVDESLEVVEKHLIKEKEIIK
jgi:hypothetical protein